METALHTFIDIFNSEFSAGDVNVQLKKIVIPIIQRDYAQGRMTNAVKRVRSRFLDALYKAFINNEPIILDFVYGDIDSQGIMTPLDGQQRLTTLFLLHWYEAKRNNISPSEYGFLKSFSYETRYSARDFCENLINNYNPTFNAPISEEIIDQNWFPLDWKKDPTISSMLVMLDDIHAKFFELNDAWTALKEGIIKFYFLPIKDMGLTDELYIKMNSRGKPLTQFEHFKAELERSIGMLDNDLSKKIIRKIDSEWTDMLWVYSNNSIIDDMFLRYFHFICDIIRYHKNETPQGKTSDEFEIIDELFHGNDAIDNISTLEQYFDVWYNLQKECSISDFFTDYISNDNYQQGKILIDGRYQIDILKDCFDNYSEVLGNGNRQFPLNRIILLYAFIVYLLNKQQITQSQFRRRLRIVNNLIQNSEDEISDSENRTSGNRMPAILRQVDHIVIKGIINDDEKPNLNIFQIEEEKKKQDWINTNSEDSVETLYKLEDHKLLHGQISIIGLDNYDNFNRFVSLFDCNWDLVDCALLSIGDYSQPDNWRRQLGSESASSWNYLFHKRRGVSYEETSRILNSLLNNNSEFSDESLLQIINDFLCNSENESNFDWRYYRIKYQSFRPNHFGNFGKYFWDDFVNKPYEFLAMKTSKNISENSYQPFLNEFGGKYLSKDDYGKRLIIGNIYIICENTNYSVCRLDDNVIIEKVEIEQEAGIDKENRIEKMRDRFHGIIEKAVKIDEM